ncbi:MAG: Mth938-like domain-containing protein [Nitriliruptorales bacterium]
MSQQSPRITGLSWGSVETQAGSFRDAKLWPGGGRGWDWNETGTDHTPGVQPADVQELLNHGAEVIVVGQGQQGRLQVMDATLSEIEERGASAEVLETQSAVERYNELAEQGAAVGALIHSTC